MQINDTIVKCLFTEVLILKRYNPQKDSVLFQLNTGTVVFGIIFLYIVIRVIISFQSETLSIYEVQNSYIDTNIKTTALILRQETLVNTSSSNFSVI